MVDANGVSRREHYRNTNEDISLRPGRYGFCCPNNPSYRKFVFEQMAEMNDYFEFDGMFFDMPFWPHACYCVHCQKRWAEEVGGEMPVRDDWNDAKWLRFTELRRKWMGEFVGYVTREMKRLREGGTVELNFAMAVVIDPYACCAESVNEACDFAGGDLYGGIMEQSFTCKFYTGITKHQPFEYMFSRCTPDLSCHTVTKSVDQMKTAIALTTAHHGATLIIDAIDPVGTLDKRVYERVGEVVSWIEPYDSFLSGEQKTDVGVYFSLNSKFKRNGRTYSNPDCCVSAVKSLIARHIPVGVTGRFTSINGYSALIAPSLTDEDAQDVSRLTEYVQNGGTLYFSGVECSALMRILGIELIGMKDVEMAYVAPMECMDFGWFNREYPLPFAGPAPLVKSESDGVLATLTLPYTERRELRFASIHSNPPGVKTEYPAMISRKLGKGKLIWSAFPLELQAGEAYCDILTKLIMPDKPTFKSNAPEDVELTLFGDGEKLTLAAVKLSEACRVTETEPFMACGRCEQKPKRVVHLPDSAPIDFTWDGEYVHFTIQRFHILSMVQVLL